MKKNVLVDIKTTSNLHNEVVDKQLEIYSALIGRKCRLSGVGTMMNERKETQE